MDHEDDPTADVGGFSRQRKPKTDPLCCPICGVTLRASEIDQHFALEVDRLDKILKPKQNPAAGCYGAGTSASSSSMAVPGTSGGGGLSNGHAAENGESSTVVNPDECWGTYQKIKNNRQARLKMKSRKRKTEDNVCPICNKTILDELTAHVDACLRKTEINGSNGGSRMADSDDDDASIDVEGGENFEVYEWAGQTRVRTTSSLHQSGSFASTTVRVTNADDTDDELNVDGDETQIYGPPQYSERDIIYPIVDNLHKDSYLRGLVMANEPVTLKRRPDHPDTSAGEGPSRAHQPAPQLHPTPSSENGQSTDQIIESLKSKVREYEGFIQNRPKCLICMDDFRKPVVSICCWHVYCEECWLHTLGAKKLCPQCSMITSPTDLRRIYL